jgi:hypothetical protein
MPDVAGADADDDPGTLACPVADCAETWPDTYGATGGRRARFLHVYAAHGDGRGLPFKRLL